MSEHVVDEYVGTRAHSLPCPLQLMHSIATIVITQMYHHQQQHIYLYIYAWNVWNTHLGLQLAASAFFHKLFHVSLSFAFFPSINWLLHSAEAITPLADRPIDGCIDGTGGTIDKYWPMIYFVCPSSWCMSLWPLCQWVCVCVFVKRMVRLSWLTL